MTESNPLVSVVVPTYYRNDRLREALDSVVAQEYDPIELFVVDSADDENARPVVEEFVEAERVEERDGVEEVEEAQTVEQGERVGTVEGIESVEYVHVERDEGPQAARSVGAERASGEYVQFLDDDDRLAPSKIAKQVPLLEPPVGVAYCGMVDEARGEILPNPAVRGDVLERALEMRTFPCINSTMLVDADVLAEALPLKHRHGADDTGLKIELALSTEFDYVNEALVHRGRTGTSLSESWRYLDGRKRVIETFDGVYRTFPPRVRRRAVRETHYQAGKKLLEDEGWSPRATLEFAKAAYYTPEGRVKYVGETLASMFGQRGVRAANLLLS